MQAYYAKKESWFEGDRFILHPELYKKQIRGYVTEELPELLATYVRGQFRGSTEKITIVRIKEVCAAMIEENPNWWHSPNRKKIFLERFRLAYPKCCDGEKPTKSSEIKTAPPIPKGKKAKQHKSGCTVLLVLVLLGLVWAFNPFSSSSQTPKPTQPETSQPPQVKSEASDDPKQDVITQEPQPITTLENTALPITLVSTEEITLLDKTGKLTIIPTGAIITVESRGSIGTLTTRINGALFVGNEERFSGKVIQK